MSAISSSSHVALSPNDFRLASMMRSGCEISASSSCCDCGKELDILRLLYHLITCKTGGSSAHSQLNFVSVF